MWCVIQFSLISLSLLCCQFSQSPRLKFSGCLLSVLSFVSLGVCPGLRAVGAEGKEGTSGDGTRVLFPVEFGVLRLGLDGGGDEVHALGAGHLHGLSIRRVILKRKP